MNVIILLTIIPNLNNPGIFAFINSSSSEEAINRNDNNNEPNKDVKSSRNDLTDVQNSQNMFVLKAATHIDPNPAKGGGEINIIDNMALVSESGVSGTTLDREKTNYQGKISRYEVREGDTLSQIAEMFGVTTNTIRWANDFEGSIQPGQSLVILPVVGLTHTVKHGGTISDVANIYEADVREIALFNGLSEDQDLKPGDEIIVPNANPVEPAPSSSGQSGSGDTKAAPTRAYASSPSTTSSGSYYTNPVPGGIITQGIHGYNAIDIASSYGTPILASASGRVVTSKEGGWNGGYGNYLVISHDNGTQTLYSHNSRNTVYVGEYVEKGQVVGYMGSTGRSTGNHLHFEVRGATNPISSCAVGSVCR